MDSYFRRNDENRFSRFNLDTQQLAVGRFILLNKAISMTTIPTPAHPKQDMQVLPGHLEREISPVNPLDAPITE